MHAGFTNNARIIPGIGLSHAVNGSLPATVRFFDCWIILQHNAGDFA